MKKTRVRRLAHRVTSSSVAWGGVMTLLRGVGFLVVMAYALRKIPTPEIGLWYVMLSIAGLGSIVEFGFAATISRYGSYYSGGSAEIPAVGTTLAAAGAMNTRAIAALVRMAHRLYIVFGLLVGVLMLLAWVGWRLWGDGPAHGVGPRESAAFLLLVVGTAFNMTGMYWPAILYGMNRVHEFNQWMVAGLVANYVLALIGLVAGAGILALVAGQIVGSLVPRLAARRLVRAQLRHIESREVVPISWRELWPTTWRAGVLTLCTYLMIGITTVFCYVFADIRTAASYGLTMQMALMLHTTSALWLWVKIPVISAMRAQGNWNGILAILRWRVPASLVTYGIGAAIVIVAAPWVLSLLESRTEMLPRPAMLALLVLVGLDLIVGIHSALLQTGNEVPHMRAFCVSAFFTLVFMWPLGTRFQVWGIIAAPFLGQLVANYWWVPYQFWERLQAGIRRQEGTVVP
jgi:hypothetical protein